MAGCDIDSGNASKLSHCKGKLRCGAQGIENIGFYTVGSQAQRCFFGKFRGHAAGVMGNRHALGLTVHCCYVICQTLCGLSHCVDVHAVNTGTDHTSKTCGTKFQLFIKAFFHFIFIIFNCFQLFFGIFIKIRVGEPFLIKLFVVHILLPPCATLIYSGRPRHQLLYGLPDRSFMGHHSPQPAY